MLYKVVNFLFNKGKNRPTKPFIDIFFWNFWVVNFLFNNGSQLENCI